MSTAVWTKYESHHQLCPGDEVKLSPLVQLPQGVPFVGTVINRKRVNYLVMLGDRRYNVKPFLITEFSRGTGALPKSEINPTLHVITSSAKMLQECSVGDIVLLHRGKIFDVVLVKSMPALSGTFSGFDLKKRKTYGYKATWFVQKLDGERFV